MSDLATLPYVSSGLLPYRRMLDTEFLQDLASAIEQVTPIIPSVEWPKLLGVEVAVSEHGRVRVIQQYRIQFDDFALRIDVAR